MARNKFDVDERLESQFSFKHLKRSMKYVRNYKKPMLLAVFCNIVSILISLTQPVITQHVLDVTVPSGNIREVVWLSLLFIATILISITMITIRARIMARVGQGIIYEIRADLFEHLQRLPFSYYDDRPHGKILVRVVQYVNNVSDMLSNGIINFLLDILNLVFITIFMFFVDARLAWIIFAGLPVLGIIMFIIKPAQRRAWQDNSNKNSNMNAYLHESINGVKITQLFTRQKTNSDIYENLCGKARSSFIHAIKIGLLVSFSVDNIAQIVSSMVYVAGVFWIAPAVTFGTIMAMGNYSWRFWQPITSLATIYNSFITTIAYLERIFETMDEPVVVDNAPDAYQLPEIVGEVRFEDVIFSYDGENVVLDNVNFTVEPGESVALVGPTGAGKTTIVNLLSRFYNLDSGRILIDGHDISGVTLNSLRSQMGIMLQDSFIFSGNIEDNVRYGKLDATLPEIIEACKAVHAHEFINEMGEKYQTEVNERGSRLSQGQKQLLSFARTLISDPKILVLDEATSSIDTKTEVYVQDGINRLMQGRTSFIIAHRLSTIKHCDKIMYIDRHNIVESGTHDELMERGGEYYKLYTAKMTEM